MDLGAKLLVAEELTDDGLTHIVLRNRLGI
jgi:hypothetical protein